MDITNSSNYGQFGSMDTSSLSEKGSAMMKREGHLPNTPVKSCINPSHYFYRLFS